MEDDRINWNSRAQSGETEETREVIRRYLPMREYTMGMFGAFLYCDAEVECHLKTDDLEVWDMMFLQYTEGDKILPFPNFMLSCRPGTNSDTWKDIIEREICRQAAELPGWKNEYKED
jgi:hypothetical protein